MHDGESAHQRYRHHNTGNERGSPVAQKEKYHQHHQRHREQERMLHVLNAGPNRGSAIHRHLQMHGGGDLLLQLREELPNVVDGLDNIGIRLPIDDHKNRRLAVIDPRHPHIFDAVGDRGDISQPHRRGIAERHHQLAVFGRREQLVCGGDRTGIDAVVNAPLGAVGIGRLQRPPHVVEAEAEPLQDHRIEADAHRGRGSAADEDLSDSWHLRNFLLDNRGGRILQLGSVVERGGQRQNHDGGVGGIHLARGWIGGQVGRQAATGCVHRRLHVAGGRVDVSAEVKLQRDGGLPERAGGGHFGDASNQAELPFQRGGNGGGHRLGAGPRKRGTDAHRRILHLRQWRNRQKVVADGACERDRQGQQ